MGDVDVSVRLVGQLLGYGSPPVVLSGMAGGGWLVFCWKDGDGFDFDEDVGEEELGDAGEGAGGRVRFAEVFGAHFADDGELVGLEVLDVPVELDDVGKVGAGGGEGGFEVVEGLFGLHAEVASAEDSTLFVHRYLARDEDHLAGHGCDDVGVAV